MRVASVVFASLTCASLASAPAWPLLADEPRHRVIDVGRAIDAGGPAPIDVKLTRTPPDPPPLVERSEWVFDLRWDHGDVWLLRVGKVDLPAPQPTPRAMGRFALELFEGPVLIERVRFDFPLLGPPEGPDTGLGSTPSFSARLRTRVGAIFPATSRGTRLELWDRATDRRWSVPWPPQEGLAASSAEPAPSTPAPARPASGPADAAADATAHAIVLRPPT